MFQNQLHTLNVLQAVRAVHRYTFPLQPLRQMRCRTVIAHDQEALRLEIARQGTHSDAANAQEVKRLYIFVANHRKDIIRCVNIT